MAKAVKNKTFEKWTDSVANPRMRAASLLWTRIAFGVLDIDDRQNPFSKMGLGGGDARDVVWLFDELEIFVHRAFDMKLASIGATAALAFEFCQRLIDIRLLLWRDLDEIAGVGVGTIRQHKTGATAYVAMTPFLVSVLEQMPRAGENVIIAEATGAPYSNDLLGKKARLVLNDLVKRGRLRPELRLGDLRRSGLTELGRAGASRSLQRSISGHTTDRVLAKHYDPAEASKARETLAIRLKARSGATSANDTELDAAAS